MVAVKVRDDNPTTHRSTAPAATDFVDLEAGRSSPVSAATGIIVLSIVVLVAAAVTAASRSPEVNEAGVGSAETDTPTADDSIDVATSATGDGAAQFAAPLVEDEMPAPEPMPLDGTMLAGFARAEIDLDAAMADNLAMIQAASVRNRNHDDSAHAATPQADLVLENHYGPRSDYLNRPDGHPENSFPVANGGQFRAACEFSHFAYDDPLVYPAKPGASHLHMFFGNTEANAYTTYDSLINSGSSTCNGQELNRTGYWAPAVFDGKGNVRIPERIVIYYKGENLARGRSEVYPPGAAMIATENLNALPHSEGGANGVRLGFLCTDNFSSNSNIGSQTMANCDGSRFGTNPDGPRWTVLEVSIKFPQCWNGQDPADWTNFSPPVGDWYVSRCEGEYNHTFPNLEYFINYRVEPGENTADWFLASDVDPVSFNLGDEPAGSTIHADWWGGWHPEVNRMWIDNCVNYVHPDRVPSGCGRGYLTDGGPDGNNPYDGPALKMRPDYTGPLSVSAETLYNELCPDPMRAYTRPTDAAYCQPGSGHGGHSGHSGHDEMDDMAALGG